MLKIAVDFDGVLVDLMSQVIEEMNKKLEKKIKYDDITDWNWLTKQGFLDNEELYQIFITRDTLTCKPIDKDAGKYINKLGKKYIVDIVTSRILRDGVREDMEKKLEKMGIKYNQLIIMDGKDKDKLDYDLFIDDNPNLADALLVRHAFVLEGMKKPKIMVLFDQPWNRNVEQGYKGFSDVVFRIKTWEEVYIFIKSLEKKII